MIERYMATEGDMDYDVGMISLSCGTMWYILLTLLPLSPNLFCSNLFHLSSLLLLNPNQSPRPLCFNLVRIFNPFPRTLQFLPFAANSSSTPYAPKIPSFTPAVCWGLICPCVFVWP
ncbi:hypothetical protein RJT34_14476 [Clitoria ternatea]|uniref:Uncharacterized protein n=1 Tax=Clitoria ternatea TaxID=43366 RepID=A0AAN9JQT8_CLITE